MVCYDFIFLDSANNFLLLAVYTFNIVLDNSLYIIGSF